MASVIPINTSNTSNTSITTTKVVDPIEGSKKLSLIVLGAIILMSPIIVVGNCVWLFSDGFTVTGLPIQKHLGQDVWTTCDSKQYILVLNGVCNNNKILDMDKANDCMRWGNIDSNKWQVINDNNNYFQRYDYDIVKEVNTLWPFIEIVSIISTIISISNFIIILPLADFTNRFFYLDAQKLLLLLSTILCFANTIVILYILYLTSEAKILQSLTWTEQTCRFRVQQSFGLFLLLVALVFAVFSIIVSLFSYEIICIDCVAPLPPDISEIIKEQDPYKFDDLSLTMTDKDPSLKMLGESATKEKLKKILKENYDSDDSDDNDQFFNHVKFQVHRHRHHDHNNSMNNSSSSSTYNSTNNSPSQKNTIDD